VRGELIGAAIIISMISVTTHEFMAWTSIESERKDTVCKIAQEHMKNLEIQARAMVAGLSVEALAEAENTEVGKLVRALDTAKNNAEVEAVIEAHAAELEAQEAAADAELKNQESQLFLEQQVTKQRITTDIKLQIKRARKAVIDACE